MVGVLETKEEGGLWYEIRLEKQAAENLQKPL